MLWARGSDAAAAGSTKASKVSIGLVRFQKLSTLTPTSSVDGATTVPNHVCNHKGTKQYFSGDTRLTSLTMRRRMEVADPRE